MIGGEKVDSLGETTDQNCRLLKGQEMILSRAVPAAPDNPQTSVVDSLHKFFGLGPAKADLRSR